jgi:DNA helicase HerA-like ATPase
MSATPGSKALTEAIRTTVRLQRHYGARLIISTQEPTLLTDLIALCSITVVHRFSSPEWFAAIKRHIPMAPDQYQATMVTIERLETGTALVYSPSAVLGQHEDRRLVKGAGKLLEVRMRKRITIDGGQSLLAV